MGNTSEAFSGLTIAILTLILVLGLAALVLFLLWKVYQLYNTVNKLTNDIETLRKHLIYNITKLENQIDEIVDACGIKENVSLRHAKQNEDSVIAIREDDNSSQHSSGVSDRSMVRPSVVVKIDKDIVNIYGHAPTNPQLIGIAQEQFKNKLIPGKNIGFDQMNIKTKTSKDYQTSSRKRETIYEGRPTSVLIRTIDSPENSGLAEKGIFVHKTIGDNGGILELFGMTLVIPSGTLSEDTKMTFGATWDTSLYPNLDKREAILSPVVVCQPSLSFQNNVTLSFPHCAISPSSDWTLKVLYRQSNLHDTTTEWKHHIQSEDSNIDINEQSVVLQLKHFTLFCLSGKSVKEKVAKKAVKLLAFTTPFQSEKMFKVRIYCINDYKLGSEELENIEKEVKGINLKKGDVMQPLVVQDNCEDIDVKLKNLSVGWTLDGKKNQTIDFDGVWRSLSPSCAFIFFPQNETISKIICDFIYNQKPSKKFHSLKIAEEQVQYSPLALKDKLGKTQKIMQKLVLLLDPKSDNDYQVLAEKIGFTYQQIQWLETQPSPTETLLRNLMASNKQITDLKKPLLQMGRLDAVSEIEEAEKD